MSPRARMQAGEAVSRTANAVFGGYALAYAFCAGCAGILAVVGLSKPDAVVTATMLSFPLYVAAICYAYGARNARRAWLGIACGIAVFGLAAALSRLAL